MKTLLLNLCIFSFTTFFSFSQKYYTLASGNWNNTTNVWSLNGVTPCGCFPGNNLLTDSVYINHPVSLTATINASTLSKIQINPGGNLSTNTFDMVINNSIVLANGSVSIRNLSIATGGRFEIYNSTLIVSINMDIYGSFYSQFSNISAMGGNIQVFPSGSFIIGDHSRLHFLNGNFKNEGYVSICSNCCLSFDKGNVTNEAGATFTGGGTVTSSVGNIKNYGTWDPTITYCSSGNDVGMVSPENCSLANQICTFAPLPTDLVSFSGYAEENVNLLYWETASETNTDHYKLDRSIDGINWNLLGQINSTSPTGNIYTYNFSDYNALEGLTYYRLSKLNTNGDTEFSRTLSVFRNGNEDILIYPNPTSDKVWVQIKPNNSIAYICLTDISGRVIKEIETGDALSFELQLPNDNGLYFIHSEGQDFTHTYTLVKN
jgi:hypothetical protein